MKSYVGITKLSENYAKKYGKTYSESEEVVKNMVSLLEEALLDANCDGIQFVDFLTIQKVKRNQRVGRNPKDASKPIIIPEKLGFKVVVGNKFDKTLNS